MQFLEFAKLDRSTVAKLVADKVPRKLGVGIPFNGTRRWYLATSQQASDQIYSADYANNVKRRMWDIIEMMFEDGVTAVYTPLMGRSLMERGPEYMDFAAQAVAWLTDDEAIQRYRAHHIAAACYGETNLLPDDVRECTEQMHQATQLVDARYHLYYGVFADRAKPDLIARTVDLYRNRGQVPTEDQLAEVYYGGPPIPIGMWVGSDQPTVFDVPMVTHENTALYFLQFPTLYLDHTAWRRLLFDYLFVRGDQESLYPDNLTDERHIMGLGVRQNSYWLPSTT